MLLRLRGREESHYPVLFREMYRARHDVFVERRGWRSLQWELGLERDRYDTPTAIYFVDVGGGRTIHAAARLLKTSGPHLLADVYPHLVAGCIPRGPETREVTRFFVSNAADAGKRKQRILGLSYVLFQCCHVRQITRLSCVVDASMVPVMERHGWACEALGPAQPYAEGRAIALLVDVAGSLQEVAARLPAVSRKDPTFVGAAELVPPLHPS